MRGPWTRPWGSSRLSGRRRVRAPAVAVLTLIAALGCWSCDQPQATSQSIAPVAPGATDVAGSVSGGDVLPGEAPSPDTGPDLGEAWTTEPDPEAFITLADGTMVAPDQYLVMLDRSATREKADAVAASIGGEIGGHIEYLGLWKVLVWPNYHAAIISDRLETLSRRADVLAASTVGLVELQAGPDCAPGLADQVYAGDNWRPMT